MLHGVQHFGAKGKGYMVSTEVKDTADGSSLVKQSGSYISERDKACPYYGFSVKFDHPIPLVEKKEYKLESLIKEPESWYGTQGQKSVECQGVLFTFSALSNTLVVTNETQGQFPVLFWSTGY